MCGLCLPHCPTYGLLQDEGDSPRGRLALIHGLDSGEIAVNNKLLGHLDRCLECGACEAMCPSEVPFTRLMDTARARIASERTTSSSDKAAQTFGYRLLANPARLKRVSALLRLYQQSGLQALVRKTGILGPLGLRKLESALPPLQKPVRLVSPTEGRRGRVALFSGCISSVADSETQRAIMQLLGALDYSVEIPEKQVCCGALPQHNGEPLQAENLASTNIDAFDPTRYSAIISAASGCSAHLANYARLYGADRPDAVAFTEATLDIVAFLARQNDLRSLTLRPLDATVAVHDPCTLRNGLRQHRSVYSLLKHIPSLKTISLDDSGSCCGAAGSYVITQPTIAAQLRDAQIDRLKTLNVQILVSANIGCALHLTNGIREAGLKIEVIHPATLLARQLP